MSVTSLSQTERPDAVVPEPATASTGRSVGVAIRDAERDRAALEWAAADVVVGRDAIHVIHAFVPLRLGDCRWPPVERARDARRQQANRLVGESIHEFRQARAGLVVEGSAVGGLPEDVLIEFSVVLDLLVIGDDRTDPSIHRSVTARVRDHARCPVAVVPADRRADDERPVTLFADDRGIDAAAFEIAADLAQRRGVGMQVARPWLVPRSPDREAAALLTAAQEAMDIAVASWSARRPDLAVTVCLELGSDWATHLRAASSVIVVPAAAAYRLDVGESGGCAVLTVPAGTAGGPGDRSSRI